MSPDNQPIFDMLRDIHQEQLKTTSTLGEVSQSLKDMKEDAVEMKIKVDRHERVYVIGKFFGVPAFAIAQFGLKRLLGKLGL